MTIFPTANPFVPQSNPILDAFRQFRAKVQPPQEAASPAADPGMTPDQIANQRKVAEALLERGTSTAPIGHWTQGVARVMDAVSGARQNRRAGEAETANADASRGVIEALLGQAAPGAVSSTMGAPGMGAAPAGFTLPQGDVSAARGDPSWDAIRQGIFAGESGGDYDALFGYSNRDGGQFSGTRLTDMTLDEALSFADPSGPYGQWVKGQVGRVATPMGAYQVVGTTLRGAKEGLGLTGSERMTPELQDAIGQWIYQTQGTGAWEGYRGPRAGGTRVAQAAPVMSDANRAAIVTALSDPRMSPEARAVATAMLQQQMQQQQRDSDPMRALELERAQIELEALRNPQQMTPYQQEQIRLQEERLGLDRERLTLPGSRLGSQEILEDGTIIQSTSAGPRVFGPNGAELTGDAAASAIMEARRMEVENQRAIYGARREGTLGADIELGGTAASAVKSGEIAANFGAEAYESFQKAVTSLAAIDEAIAAIDAGAESGLVQRNLPNVTLASASLENAMNRMGLDVIGSVTFGALSEGEMRLAMDTAVPRDLAPLELRQWLERKRDAQQKAADALLTAGRYLSTPGNTLQSWIESQHLPASPTAPVASPVPGGAASSAEWPDWMNTDPSTWTEEQLQESLRLIGP